MPIPKKILLMTFSLLLFLGAKERLNASIYLIPPTLFYPEYGELDFLSQGYAWAELSKATPYAFDNESIGFTLSNGYKVSLLNSKLFNFVLGVNLSMLNGVDLDHTWYFVPRKLLTDVNTTLYYNVIEAMSLSLSYHHDCAHDIDLNVIRPAIHDWFGLGFHFKPFEVQPKEAKYKSLFRIESEIDYFIAPLYPTSEKENQKGRISTIIQNEILTSSPVDFFWELRGELFILDLTNQYQAAPQKFYVDRALKAGMRVSSSGDSQLTLYTKLEFLYDPFLNLDYDPGRYLSIGFSLES